MIDILEFAFRDFWTWLGCWLFLGTICTAIANVRLVVVKESSATIKHVEQRGGGAKETVKVG